MNKECQVSCLRYESFADILERRYLFEILHTHTSSKQVDVSLPPNMFFKSYTLKYQKGIQELQRRNKSVAHYALVSQYSILYAFPLLEVRKQSSGGVL